VLIRDKQALSIHPHFIQTFPKAVQEQLKSSKTWKHG